MKTQIPLPTVRKISSSISINLKHFIFTDVHLEVSILVQQYEKKINIITYIYNSFNYTEQI